MIAVLGKIQNSLLLCSTKIKSIMKLLQLVLTLSVSCMLAISCKPSPPNQSNGENPEPTIQSEETAKTKVPLANAIQMKNEYAKDRKLLGKFKKSMYKVGVDDLTVERNTQGRIINASVNEDRALHSWWIPKSDLDSIYKIDSLVGLRIYPGIDRASIKILDTNQTEFVLNYNYHTLVFTGTQASGQDTINAPQWYQYVTVCPDRCFKNNSGRYP